MAQVSPLLSAEQIAQLTALYGEWNAKINVVSRKDIDNLYLHHVVHSLAIAKAFSFVPGTTILDVGTGGGFPGIPLALVCPHCSFTLIDGTAKKIRVVKAIAEALQLTNVTAVARRAEDETGRYDFIVSRAVMPLPDLYRLTKKNLSPHHRNAMLNGLIVLKGGDLTAELHPFAHKAEVIPISTLFDNSWFQEKYVIYIPN